MEFKLNPNFTFSIKTRYFKDHKNELFSFFCDQINCWNLIYNKHFVAIICNLLCEMYYNTWLILSKITSYLFQQFRLALGYFLDNMQKPSPLDSPTEKSRVQSSPRTSKAKKNHRTENMSIKIPKTNNEIGGPQHIKTTIFKEVLYIFAHWWTWQYT